jgi:hypothetical protein
MIPSTFVPDEDMYEEDDIPLDEMFAQSAVQKPVEIVQIRSKSDQIAPVNSPRISGQEVGQTAEVINLVEEETALLTKSDPVLLIDDDPLPMAPFRPVNKSCIKLVATILPTSRQSSKCGSKKVRCDILCLEQNISQFFR